MSKEIMELEEKIERLEEKMERLEIRLEQINLSEIIVKGRKIIEIYNKLNEHGIIDTFDLNYEILEIKKRLNNIEYHPWEWLERDPKAREAFLSYINRNIAREIRQIGLFALYQDNPSTVINAVKDTVRDYLNIWEVNDQVALQIVDKIMRDKYFEVILKNVMGFVTSSNFPQAVVHVLKDKYNKELSDIKKKIINEG